MYINVKKTIMVTIDIALAVYLFFAMTSFNTPDDGSRLCTKVCIVVSDKSGSGFLDEAEIKKILIKNKVYPQDSALSRVNTRVIEDVLLRSAFVSSAECYKTQDGHVYVTVSQQLPVIRVKSINGDDYYLDEFGGTMPNSKYTSDLIIASGHISLRYARGNLLYVAQVLMSSDLWRNQIEQIYLRADEGIELIPRVGDHVIYLGRLPEEKKGEDRRSVVTEFVNGKLRRMENFYKYGLSQAGWNAYSEISLDYDNQIVCKKRKKQHSTPNI